MTGSPTIEVKASTLNGESSSILTAECAACGSAMTPQVVPHGVVTLVHSCGSRSWGFRA